MAINTKTELIKQHFLELKDTDIKDIAIEIHKITNFSIYKIREVALDVDPFYDVKRLLGETENEVYKMCLKGKSQKEISKKMGCNYSTVATTKIRLDNLGLIKFEAKKYDLGKKEENEEEPPTYIKIINKTGYNGMRGYIHRSRENWCECIIYKELVPVKIKLKEHEFETIEPKVGGKRRWK